jgi:hypothetical protein
MRATLSSRAFLQVHVASAVRVRRQYGHWAMTGKTPGADPKLNPQLRGDESHGRIAGR